MHEMAVKMMSATKTVVVGGLTMIATMATTVVVAQCLPEDLLAKSPIALTVFGTVGGALLGWYISKRYSDAGSLQLERINSDLGRKIDALIDEHKTMQAITREATAAMTKAGDKGGETLMARAQASSRAVESILARNCPVAGCGQKVMSPSGVANDFAEGVVRYYYNCPTHGRFMGGWEEFDVD